MSNDAIPKKLVAYKDVLPVKLVRPNDAITDTIVAHKDILPE